MWIDRRLLLVAGGLSLLLNVFLVGLVTGRLVTGRTEGAVSERGDGRARRVMPPGSGGPGPVVHQGHLKLLSPEERRRFQEAMQPYRLGIRAARETLRARRQAAEAAMTATDYDHDAVAAALAALRSADSDVAAKLHAGLIEAMAALPQPARAALVAHERSTDDAAATIRSSGDDRLKEQREGARPKAPVAPGTEAPAGPQRPEER